MNDRAEQVAVCKICGMMYMKNLEDDVAKHDDSHDMAVNGVVCENVIFKKTIMRLDKMQIVAVVHNSGGEAEKLLAQKVATVAKRATERNAAFNWISYDAAMLKSKLNYHTFLCLIEGRVVGMLAMCRRKGAIWKRWGASFVGGAMVRVRWNVDMVWVAHDWRRNGVAKLMIEQAAFSLGWEIQQLVWASPFTEDGMSLVKNFCPESFYYR